jgi:hypothetical protein
MDLDKALYMREFLQMREDLGSTELYAVQNTLFTNLYETKPKEQIKEIKQVIEDIQDKTIHLLKKEDQHVFFPDLPELIEEKEEVNEIKVIQVSDEKVDGKGETKGGTMKTVTLDPSYVATDS